MFPFLIDYKPLNIVEGITKGQYYLPVTRYSGSPETGLYHTEYQEDKIHGTFFYYEPESNTYLTAESFLVAQTKCSALQYILEHYTLDSELFTTSNKNITEYINADDFNGLWEKRQS